MEFRSVLILSILLLFTVCTDAVTFIDVSPSTNGDPGKELVLACTTKEKVKCSWEKDGIEIDDGEAYKFESTDETTDCSLTIVKFRLNHDVGKFTCAAELSGVTETRNIEITENTMPDEPHLTIKGIETSEKLSLKNEVYILTKSNDNIVATVTIGKAFPKFKESDFYVKDDAIKASSVELKDDGGEMNKAIVTIKLLVNKITKVTLTASHEKFPTSGHTYTINFVPNDQLKLDTTKTQLVQQMGEKVIELKFDPIITGYGVQYSWWQLDPSGKQWSKIGGYSASSFKPPLTVGSITYKGNIVQPRGFNIQAETPKIVIETKALFEVEPSDTKGSLGKAVTLKCRTKIPVKCSWHRSYSQINLPADGTHYNFDTNPGVNCDLTINEFSIKKDIQEFTCLVDAGGESFISSSAKVTAGSKPNTSPPLKITGVAGEEMLSIYTARYILTEHNNNIKAQITISKAFPAFEDGAFSMTNNGKELKFTNTSEETNDGTYQAIIKFELDKVSEIQEILFTMKHPEIQSPDPYTFVFVPGTALRLNTRSLIQELGEKKEQIGLVPPIAAYDTKYQWKVFDDNKEWTDISGSTKATFKPPSDKSGSVKYKVSVRQEKGFNIDVETPELLVFTYEPMTFVNITTPTEVSVKFPTSTTLKCEADGNPPPELKWMKVEKFGMKIVEKKAELSLGNAEDSGRYKCGATQTLLGQVVILNAPQIVDVKING